MRIVLALIMLLSICSTAFAEINYVNPYYRKDGTYVSGHYKDTSRDGYDYNNANAQGLNDAWEVW